MGLASFDQVDEGRGFIGATNRLLRVVQLLCTGALIILAGCSNSGTSSSIPVEPKIFVAAASDLRFAFTDLGNQFTRQTGTEVVFTFGSSGQLKEQILNGAPFDIFASANEQFVTDLVRARRAAPDTVHPYAMGRIVMTSRSGLDVPRTVEELNQPQFGRIAIANPAHAPYGIAAREALVSAGILDDVEDRLVFGENVSDALRLVETGNVDVAIVALSLVVAGSAKYQLIDQQLHEPLKQSLVVTRTGSNQRGAQEFVDYLASNEGKTVMSRYGFTVPEEGK